MLIEERKTGNQHQFLGGSLGCLEVLQLLGKEEKGREAEQKKQQRDNRISHQICV